MGTGGPPTDAQIEAVVDEFEKTAWAGLEPGRYSLTAVLHREHGGGVYVHVLTARCDLETGKSLNIAPPGWQKIFDPLRDALNHEHGWSRSDDSARARTQQPDPAPRLRRGGEPAGRLGARGRPAMSRPRRRAGVAVRPGHAVLWPGSTPWPSMAPEARRAALLRARALAAWSVDLPAGTRLPCGRLERLCGSTG